MSGQSKSDVREQIAELLKSTLSDLSPKLKIERTEKPFGLLAIFPKDTRTNVRLFFLVRLTVRPLDFPEMDKRMSSRPSRSIPMLAAPKMSEKTIAKALSRGWGYIDDAGNCELKAPGLLVKISGNFSLRPARSFDRPPTSYDLSSDKANKVLGVILADPNQLDNQTIRSIAAACEGEVGPTWVHGFIRYALKKSYLERTRVGKITTYSATPTLLVEWMTARFGQI